mmetsp:Transcript_82693/g.145949  ORF Transcript_82693/g.145949 Transcript_82693/m.145949 type:complete len:1599 (-) Transcript_82693:62-4858(-)
MHPEAPGSDVPAPAEGSDSEQLGEDAAGADKGEQEKKVQKSRWGLLRQHTVQLKEERRRAKSALSAAFLAKAFNADKLEAEGEEDGGEDGVSLQQPEAALVALESSDEEDGPREEDPHDFSKDTGPLLDHLARNANRGNPLLPLLQGGSACRKKMWDILAKPEENVHTLRSYQATMVQLQAERLQYRLMDVLTIFWKRHKHPDWENPKNMLGNHLRRITFQRTMDSCTSAALAAYMEEQDQASLEAAKESMWAMKDEEDEQHHGSRMKSFWGTFHRGGRKGEVRPLTPAKTELCLPALNGGLGWISPPKPVAARSRRGSKERIAQRPVPSSLPPVHAQPWEEGKEHRALGMTDMNWKFRAARSTLVKKSGFRTTGSEFLDPRPGKGRDRFDQSASTGALPKHGATEVGFHKPKQPPELQEVVFDEVSGQAEEDDDSPRQEYSPTDLDGKTWWWQAGQGQVTGPYLKQMKEKMAAQEKKKEKMQSASAPNLHKASPTKTKDRRGDPHTLLFSRPGTVEQNALQGRPQTSSKLPSRSQSRTGNLSRSEKKRSSGLPPIQQAIVPPYGHSSAAPPKAIHEAMNNPTKCYLHACQREQIVPLPTPFVMGQSTRIDAIGKALRDPDLLAMCSVGRLSYVEDANLAGSTLLSDRALAHFAEEVLFEDRTLRELKRLDLSRCIQAGPYTQGALVRLLGESGAEQLRFLNLGGVPLAARHIFPMCEAIEKHPYLHTLMLSNTGLANALNTKECLEKILNNQTIQVLDLGWNCFDGEELSFIGECLVETKKVKHFGLANCAASSHINDSMSPLVYFLEQLNRDDCLTSLDVSMNRIDFRGALVMEDALEHTKKLSSLNVSNNPLGVMGLRSLLRLLSRSGSGVTSLDIDNSFTGSQLGEVEGIQVFSWFNPGGRYQLDLERPYHRSILRTLYKLTEYLKIPLEASFLEVSAQPGGFQHPTSKDARGVWQVPTTGLVQFTYSVEKALEQALKGVKEENLAEVITKYNDAMRFMPDFHKLIPLLALWKRLDGRIQEQLAVLTALGRDFIFTPTILRQLSLSRSQTGNVVARLLPTLKGGQFARFMVVRCIDNMGEFAKMAAFCKEYLLFNPMSPTGHYILDLSNTANGYVAQSLSVLDRWESGIVKRKGLPDTSQNGDYSSIRNAMYASHPLHLEKDAPKSFDQWVIAEHEVLELDYVTTLRPDSNGLVLDEASFTRFLTVIEAAKCGGWRQIQVIRLLAHHLNLTCFQMRRLLGNFKTSENRREALVCLFFRIVDIQNEKVFRVRYEDQSELEALRNRLGFMNFFPYIQPEQTTYDLDLAFYDQRMAANTILSLAASERRDNITDYKYTRADGIVDNLTMGIPRGWDIFTKMPKDGVFHFTYKCSPEDRKFSTRTKLLEGFGKYKVHTTEDDVRWWAAPNEAPEDVLEFIFWIQANYENTEKAFKAFDGPDGNGVILMREFEEGMRTLKCKKFKGKNEKERWHTIFRYMDPSGEGQVSLSEFLTLDQFWAEVRFSILEFLDWSHRTFGPSLQAAWDALDDDHSGEISVDEWEATLDKVGYFGTSGPIFSYVDQDDEGNVSWEEFQALDEFKNFEMKKGGVSSVSSLLA